MAGKDTLISLIKERSKVSTQIRAQNRKKYQPNYKYAIMYSTKILAIKGVCPK